MSNEQRRDSDRSALTASLYHYCSTIVSLTKLNHPYDNQLTNGAAS